MAEAALVFQPIDAAFSGADIAGGQSGLEPLSTVLQLAGAVQSDIAWFRKFHNVILDHRERYVTPAQAGMA
jgi:hypothetical protein